MHKNIKHYKISSTNTEMSRKQNLHILPGLRFIRIDLSSWVVSFQHIQVAFYSLWNLLQEHKLQLFKATHEVVTFTFSFSLSGPSVQGALAFRNVFPFTLWQSNRLVHWIFFFFVFLARIYFYISLFTVHAYVRFSVYVCLCVCLCVQWRDLIGSVRCPLCPH